jgi:hypothetical protein
MLKQKSYPFYKQLNRLWGREVGHLTNPLETRHHYISSTCKQVPLIPTPTSHTYTYITTPTHTNVTQTTKTHAQGENESIELKNSTTKRAAKNTIFVARTKMEKTHVVSFIPSILRSEKQKNVWIRGNILFTLLTDEEQLFGSFNPSTRLLVLHDYLERWCWVGPGVEVGASAGAGGDTGIRRLLGWAGLGWALPGRGVVIGTGRHLKPGVGVEPDHGAGHRVIGTMLGEIGVLLGTI